MDPRLKALHKRKLALQAEQKAILAKDTAQRSAEESERLTAILGARNAESGDYEGGELAAVNADIAEYERASALELAQAHRDAVARSDNPSNQPRIGPVHDNPSGEPWGRAGVPPMGDFFAAVINASVPNKVVDPRLLPLAAVSGYGSSDGALGGFLVQKEFSTRLMEQAVEESLFLSRCAQQPVGEGHDGVEMPYWNDSDRSGGTVHGGVQVYRKAEAVTVTAAVGQLEFLKIGLEDMMGLAYLSDRLMTDAVGVGAFVERSFRTAYAFKIDDEILNGTGVGQMVGVITSGNGALITVTKETGQVAATLDVKNLFKMRNRMNPGSRRNAVWVMNLDLEPQLWGLTMPVGTGGVPVYLPTNGVRDEPWDTLFGLPVLLSEHAPAAGTAGDISLHDFSQYMVATKGEIQTAESMHVRFIYNENTLRFTYRINGKPTWRVARTRHKGSNTVSPHVALGARA